MNVRELLTRLDEIEAVPPPVPPVPPVPPPVPPVPPVQAPNPEQERLDRLRRTHGLSAAPATGDKAKLQQLQALVDQYLALKNKTPVKETEIAKSLMESFGYQYLAELAIGDNVTASDGIQYRLRVDPTSGQWYWGDKFNHPPKDTIKSELVQKYPEIKSRMPDAEIARLEKKFPKIDTTIKAPEPVVNPETIKTAEANPKALKGSKALGRGLTILAIAAEVWDGYEQIQALPKNLPKDQYKAEVTKIVSNLVVNFGLFYVGMMLGGLVAGVITGGPGGIVGAVLGGALGWAASKYGGEQGIDPLINDLVDHLYGVDKTKTAQSSGQTSNEKATWPNSVDEIKKFQSTHKDENGNPLTVDGQIGRWTLGALKAAGATVPAGFVPVRDKSATSNVSLPNTNGPNSSAQAQPDQLSTLKTQIQQGIKELSASPNAVIRNQLQALKTKLGPEFSAQ